MGVLSVKMFEDDMTLKFAQEGNQKNCKNFVVGAFPQGIANKDVVSRSISCRHAAAHPTGEDARRSTFARNPRFW